LCTVRDWFAYLDQVLISQFVASPMAAAVEITLRNMRFHVRVGVLPHEAELPQPLEIDLTAWVTAPEDGTLAIDYRDLYAVTSMVVAQPPLLYLEVVAKRIVASTLARPNVIGARAAVRKPNVALPGPLDYAEVVVEDGVRR
jgi:7,8-dihydroneopterin aldolase/epimerase/oxygenase